MCRRARRHTTLFRRENRYANLRANPSNFAHPAALAATARRMCAPSTPSHPFSHSPNFFLFALFLSLSFFPFFAHSFSSVVLRCSFQQRKRVSSLSVSSRTRDRRRWKGDMGGRWVRGYKTGLARVWRIVFVGHLRRQGFIEVKKVARHRLPATMKWAPSMLVSHHSSCFFLSYVSSSSHFRGYLRAFFFFFFFV